jgi:hypothetical protein
VAVGLGVNVAVGVGLYVAVAVGAAGTGPQAASALTYITINRRRDNFFMTVLL